MFVLIFMIVSLFFCFDASFLRPHSYKRNRAVKTGIACGIFFWRRGLERDRYDQAVSLPPLKTVGSSLPKLADLQSRHIRQKDCPFERRPPKRSVNRFFHAELMRWAAECDPRLAGSCSAEHFAQFGVNQRHPFAFGSLRAAFSIEIRRRPYKGE